MKRTISVLAAVTAVLVGAGAGAQPAKPGPEALPDGTFMYCDPAKAYYPSVENCPTNWRIVTSPQQPGQAQTQSESLSGSTGAQAQADPVVDQQSRAIERARSRGYELIPTVKDLILDGKALASRNAKVQIAGIYKKAGNNGVLYGLDTMDAFSGTDNYMPVLTDDAAREVREALMNPTCGQFMCRVDFGGHMTMCHDLNLLAKNYPDVPCLHVEVQIVYRPGD